MYIISACLLGENCKYNGGNNLHEKVIDLAKEHNYLAVCPEVAGGCSVPRSPCEIRDGRVYNREGEDVTEKFREGAAKVLAEAKTLAEELGEHIEIAVLRFGSPSCGSRQIYDGTFTRTLVDGDGVFAELLIENKIKIISEEEC